MTFVNGIRAILVNTAISTTTTAVDVYDGYSKLYIQQGQPGSCWPLWQGAGSKEQVVRLQPHAGLSEGASRKEQGLRVPPGLGLRRRDPS